MEVFTIVLSSLLGLLSPVGFAVDQVAEQAIRNQLDSVESLAVRVDNTPNYQLAQGRVDRIRIAGRGLYPEKQIRIAVAELETDAIAVDPVRLRRGEIELEAPLNAAVRIVLTEADLNRALQSPQITELLRDLSLNFLGSPAQQLERYDFIDPQIDLLDNRMRFQVKLQSQADAQTNPESQQQTQQTIAIHFEAGIQITAGRQLQLIEPTASIDARPVPPQLINLLVGGISQQLDLANLEERGITARILQWSIDDQQLNLAAFIQVAPEFSLQAATPKPLTN